MVCGGGVHVLGQTAAVTSVLSAFSWGTSFLLLHEVSARCIVMLPYVVDKTLTFQDTCSGSTCEETLIYERPAQYGVVIADGESLKPR